MIELLHIDCMEYMATLEDNAFDLAIVDPPYGTGINHGGLSWGRKKRPNLSRKNRPPKYKKKQWDNTRPDRGYFDELKRVSKNQIIWGANFFTDYLPPSSGWVYWGKFEDANRFADGELAYTSFSRALRTIKIHTFHGTNAGKDRIHPTQKPVKLYDWLLRMYSKPGERVLDTHLGSGSSAIAAHYFGVDFVGCELDKDYIEAARARFQKETRQIAMFGGEL